MIIFLYGPDTFRSRRKLSEIKAKFIKEIDQSALNIEQLAGQGLSLPELQKALTTPAFLASKRLVIIEDLISKNKTGKVADSVLELLNQVNLESVILVFWESDLPEGKKGGRTKTSTKQPSSLKQRLASEKLAQEFSLLTIDQAYRFAGTEISQRGGKISAEALRLLVDLTGNDLWQLNSEIDKLIAYCQDRVIGPTEVKTLIKSRLNEDVFKLTDALAAKNKKVALKLVSDQLRSGTSPSELLSQITWQFKNLLLLKSFTEQNGTGYSDNYLAGQLSLHPYVVKKTLYQLKNYQLDKLVLLYQQLLKIDRQIKTSQTDPEVMFDLLVVKN